MKKLIYMPYEQHRKWTLGAESIVDVALSNINHRKYYVSNPTFGIYQIFNYRIFNEINLINLLDLLT